MKQTTELQIEYVAIDTLKPWEKNPRKINKDDMDKLRRSIREFGFVDPLIVRKEDSRVIGGHQRLRAAEYEEWKDKVPVVFLTGLNDNESAALNIALNKIHGEFDLDMLAGVLGDLKDIEFDLDLTGFDITELDDIFEKDNGIVEGQVAEALEKPSVKCPNCGHLFEA